MILYGSNYKLRIVILNIKNVKGVHKLIDGFIFYTNKMT